MEGSRTLSPKVLVLGPPRSGFTLLISIVTKLMATREFEMDPARAKLARFLPEASAEMFTAIHNVCAKRFGRENVIISPEFKLLVGGPKWLDAQDPNSAHVRKYVGIRGVGDFLLTLKFPKSAMDFYEVIHSHYAPQRWLNDAYYRGHCRLASYRNPLDVLNSATHSLNALTGEYIGQTGADPEDTRRRLALYKLSDPNFVEGLVAPQLAYWEEFCPLMDRFETMRLEELLVAPVAVIRGLSEFLGCGVSAREASKLWDGMRYRNQTRFHEHNFRKGVVGDWRRHLVNEHLEMLEARGFNDILEQLGYERIYKLERSAYTPFQRRVEGCLRAGKPHAWEGDPNTFTFAFNKSNFVSTRYSFVELEGQGGARIERSSVTDIPFLEDVLRSVEKVLDPIVSHLEQGGRGT